MADVIFVLVLLALTLAAAEYVRVSARRQLLKAAVVERAVAAAPAEAE